MGIVGFKSVFSTLLFRMARKLAFFVEKNCLTIYSYGGLSILNDIYYRLKYLLPTRNAGQIRFLFFPQICGKESFCAAFFLLVIDIIQPADEYIVM